MNKLRTIIVANLPVRQSCLHIDVIWMLHFVLFIVTATFLNVECSPKIINKTNKLSASTSEDTLKSQGNSATVPHIPVSATVCWDNASRNGIMKDFRFSSDGSFLITAKQPRFDSIRISDFDIWDIRAMKHLYKFTVPENDPRNAKIWIDQQNMLLEHPHATRLIRVLDGTVIASYAHTRVLALAGNRPDDNYLWPSRAIVGLRSTVLPDSNAKRFFLLQDSCLALYSTIDGSLIKKLGWGSLDHKNNLISAMLTADERMLIVSDENRSRIWRVPEGTLITDLDIGDIKQSRGGKFSFGIRDSALLLWKLPEVSAYPPIKGLNRTDDVEIDRDDSKALGAYRKIRLCNFIGYIG